MKRSTREKEKREEKEREKRGEKGKRKKDQENEAWVFISSGGNCIRRSLRIAKGLNEQQCMTISEIY